MNDTIHPPAKRSGFVTGLAWSFILLAGFSTLMAVFQHLMFSLILSSEDMRVAMREAANAQGMPPMFLFMFEHFRLISAAVLGLSALTLVASIGLLKRRNWARLVFLVMMVVGIVSHLAGLVMPFFMSDLLQMPADMPADFGAVFGMIWKAAMVFGVLVTLVTIGFFVWIMKRLMSEDIRKEFLAS